MCKIIGTEYIIYTYTSDKEHKNSKSKIRVYHNWKQHIIYTYVVRAAACYALAEK